MTILDEIVAKKRLIVADRKKKVSISELEATPAFQRPVLSASGYIRNPSKTGIITEFKRQSPSKGLINGEAVVEQVVSGYEKYGASAVSILTDVDYFGGSDEDLKAGRQVLNIPVLRKDFIVDEYQILEARSLGADLILLIAACLTPQEVKKMASLVTSLGMEVLLEVHNEQELDCYTTDIKVVGVNNRDLKTFKVSLDTSLQLLERIPDEVVKISESGISDPSGMVMLRKAGFDGFLIGENFMKDQDPAASFNSFIQSLKMSGYDR